ncbi:uncharacterized protein MYCFIDRAFT_207330 [Pseudocercospora fijiensis CIRAD86]|uniref:Uncharacterized protein n=1 Tax=Pseudocercospora fijiensis (strain CIRAD86) TaxID=383855 RepID=M3AJ02_PSEFD|nr:uncharacterized protein MYCFIDRAFT_207330 [Pseudocercospora fijiensis CIRAD86]EME84576.1 hypothetical protein MYCFIDRAFT_207330 [Pseudocercospora fijiensis CIRAD86]
MRSRKFSMALSHAKPIHILRWAPSRPGRVVLSPRSTKASPVRTPELGEGMFKGTTTMNQSARPDQQVTFFTLPAEIRSAILEHVFDSNFQAKGFLGQGLLGGIFHNEDYSASSLLAPLLVCKQFYQDSSLLALTRANFIVSNLFFKIPERISILHPKQIEAIRSIAFVADARHFTQLHDWGQHPFGIKNLSLDNLTIVLRRSSNWHYLFDFTAEIVNLLRSLTNVKKFTFVRNVALVKGSFKTWYNRLIGLMLKIDHLERYDKIPANPEETWWTWSYDGVAQAFNLEAQPAKRIMDEEAYMQEILPLVEELRVSMENEEWNPDPRSSMAIQLRLRNAKAIVLASMAIPTELPKLTKNLHGQSTFSGAQNQTKH